MTRILTVAVTAVVAALALALPAVAATPTYKGTVGPGFTIKMASKPTKAGKIKLVVADKSIAAQLPPDGAAASTSRRASAGSGRRRSP